tara:strand:+ start:134 stop:673 length:540 start_codon:yes stop_codon:yes gene_type:complete
MSTEVSVYNIFPNFIGTKKLDLTKLKVSGSVFKKTFESNIKTTLNTDTLFDIDSMNYLNIELTKLLSHLLKPRCKTFVFKLTGIWINQYTDKDFQGSHVHPGDYSFIIYYKTKKSHTVLNSPVKNFIEIEGNSKLFDERHDVDLKEGDIIMFPSYMEHWVKPNSDGITIAGNIKIMETK